ncbi:ATP-binding protein [Actinomadura sp. 7K507]|uniref:sensor histidine kinase n=1 Tax=Actinomadura sp. 7K507 TaxID=2530365 RepID=UPI0010518D92|nr:ATP-binding protein [Actinomadura sp. 7K507]TDC91958.1 sensor histidine kinase [Actinomadura sp. 7K507]
MVTSDSANLVSSSGGRELVQQPEHAHALADRLTARGLRASGAPHRGSPAGAMAVSAQRVDVHPYAGRLVVLLPGPRDDDGLLWHWPRLYTRYEHTGAHWFQPFAPAWAYDATAALIEAAIEADLRRRGRWEHTSAAGAGEDAEFERQFLARMGRPLHLLIHRTLVLLDSVEREVEDTVLLHELFKIDHLTTRALRGVERQAVLGGATARQVNQPLLLGKVMRQAVAQIEQYGRVRVQVPPPQVEADLPGYAGPEIGLLLAELVENATKFSPPGTQVQMVAVPAADGVSIEITDRGPLAMSADQYAALNRLLADPDTVGLREQIIAGPIGLLVVSRLAQRHGIQVTLRPAEPEGTQATVTIPAALLTAPRPAALRPATAPAAAPAGNSGARAHLPRGTVRSPLGPATSPPTAPPEGAVIPPTAPPDIHDLAPAHSEVEARPVLPQRSRRRRPEGPAEAEDGQQTASHAATSQAGGQGPERKSGPKRGPVPGLLADFAGAARPRPQADDPADQGPGNSASPSAQPATPPVDPPVDPAVDPATGHPPI